MKGDADARRESACQRTMRTMRTMRTIRRMWFAGTGATILLVAVMSLSACGVTATTGVGGAAPTPTQTTPARGTPTAFGCGAPKLGETIPPATMMLPVKNATMAVKVGQSVGADLPATFRWTLRSDDPNQALTTLSPQGALDVTTSTCDWRFRAANPGTVTLTFSGVFQCPPHTMCPALAMALSYTLDVQA